MLGNWLSESPAPKIATAVAVKKEWGMSKGGGGHRAERWETLET